MNGIEGIPDYLLRMEKKDLEKHGYAGKRTATEIAEYFEMSVVTCRRYLKRLVEKNLITDYGRCEYIPGRPRHYGPFVEFDDDDPDGGEPIPVNDNISFEETSNGYY